MIRTKKVIKAEEHLLDRFLKGKMVIASAVKAVKVK